MIPPGDENHECQPEYPATGPGFIMLHTQAVEESVADYSRPKNNQVPASDGNENRVH